jgi:choline kinase
MSSIEAKKPVEERIQSIESDITFIKECMNKLLEKSKKNLGIIKQQKQKETIQPYNIHVMTETLKKTHQKIIIVESKDDETGFVIELYNKNFMELYEKIKTTEIGKTIDISIYKLSNENAIFNDGKWTVAS